MSYLPNSMIQTKPIQHAPCRSSNNGSNRIQPMQTGQETTDPKVVFMSASRISHTMIHKLQRYPQKASQSLCKAFAIPCCSDNYKSWIQLPSQNLGTPWMFVSNEVDWDPSCLTVPKLLDKLCHVRERAHYYKICSRVKVSLVVQHDYPWIFNWTLHRLPPDPSAQLLRGTSVKAFGGDDSFSH